VQEATQVTPVAGFSFEDFQHLLIFQETPWGNNYTMLS